MAHKFIVSILASGLMIVSAPFAQAATGEPSLYFYPAKSWQVGTAGKTIGIDGTSPACFIRNEFNNGYIIQFSGDQNRLDTVNIDFRQDVFMPGQTYPATIAIPGGARQDVTARAASKSTLNAPLPAGGASIDSLRKTSAMDFAVEGNAFRFYLTGFASSVPSYTNCARPEMASLAPPETLKPDTSKPAVSKSADNKSANNKPMAIINESIAMEQKEANKETAKEMGKAPPPPIDSNLPIIDTTADSAPVIQPVHMEEKIINPKIPAPQIVTSETASGAAKNPSLFSTEGGRKRMSETLAREIEENPDILGIDAPGNIQKRPGNNDSQASKVQDEPLKPLILNAAEPQKMPTAKISNKISNAQMDELFPELPRPAMEKPEDTTQEKFVEKSQEQQEKQQEIQITEMIPPVAETTPARKMPEKTTPPTMAPSAIKAPPSPAPVENLKAENLRQAQNLKSPPMAINKTVQKFEIDLTKDENLQDAEPAAGANDMPPGMAPDMDFESQRADTRPAPRKADPEMIQKISDLEAAIAKLKKENDALNADLKAAMREGRSEIASIAGDNWDLEKATLAYNEADRQLKRLGRQLQQARAQCDSEKQDIEAQLFDPQIASQQQQARLFELEQKLAEAEQKLQDQRARYESRMNESRPKPTGGVVP